MMVDVQPGARTCQSGRESGRVNLRSFDVIGTGSEALGEHQDFPHLGSHISGNPLLRRFLTLVVSLCAHDLSPTWTEY